MPRSLLESRLLHEGLGKKVLLVSTFLFFLTQVSGCYVLRQAWYQNNLYNSRRPVSEVIEDGKVPQWVKTQLDLVRQVLDFAAKEGLNSQESYRYYIETKSNAVSFLVQAAYPDRLKFKTWWFPITGDVPYLGFFSREERDEEAEHLRKEGFDISKGSAGAFSSLGYFEDPLYTSMLKTDRGGLVHLLLHELTHRTFWSKGSANFNENLAEYVALVLTQKFFEQRGEARETEQYLAERRDRAKFRMWLKELKAELEALYASRGTTPQDTLLAKKKEIFEQFTTKRIPRFETDAFEYVRAKEWNNAAVLAASLYLPDTDRFASAHKCFGEEKPIKEFLDALRSMEEKESNVFKALDRLCEKKVSAIEAEAIWKR